MKDYDTFSVSLVNDIFELTEDGLLRRRKTSSSNAKKGMIVRGYMNNGYVNTRINNREIRYHRLVWVLVYGDWPRGIIDHIDGNTSNNSIINLRLATDQNNSWNSKAKSTNKTGFKGVSFKEQYRKFGANIMHNKKQIFLGYFDKSEDARAAYVKAAKNLFGEFARTK